MSGCMMCSMDPRPIRHATPNKNPSAPREEYVSTLSWLLTYNIVKARLVCECGLAQTKHLYSVHRNPDT